MILAQGDWRKIALPQSHCFRVDQLRVLQRPQVFQRSGRRRAGRAIHGLTQFFDGFLILVPGGTALALEIFFFRASHERHYAASSADENYR